MSALNIEDF
jgi:hypothetical protein